MKKYEYVFSGLSMFDLIPQIKDQENNHLEIVRDILEENVLKLKADLKTLDLSVLFNAFTEKGYGKYLIDNSKFGLSNVFVDSGGLQMVTKNMTITPEKKLDIYKVQSAHEFAMCFDEIPCRDRPGSDSANSRTNVSAKIFYPELKKESALNTAKNIKQQIEYFQENNSSTKIFYIIQGNTWQDMVEWFEEGASILTPQHFKSIAGVALADTCMGNEKLETVDMIRAYVNIKNNPLLANCNRVHLLGVGSLSRLYPFLALKYFFDDIITSFDSTSFSQAWNLGGFSTGTQRMALSQFPPYFKNVLNYTSFTQEEKDWYFEHFLKNLRKKSEIYKKLPDDALKLAHTRALIIFSILYQVKGLDIAIAESLEKLPFDNSPEGMLQHIRTSSDFDYWQNEYGRFIKSKRIFRDGMKQASLEGFF